MLEAFQINTFLVLSVILAGCEQIYETFVLGPRKEKGQLKGEKWTILGMGVVHFSMFFATLIEYFLSKKHLNYTVSFIGLGIYLFAVWLRYWSIYSLGKFWSIHIEIRNDQSLVKNGPYRFMRHPSYLALFLKVPSVPLILNSYLTCILVILAYFPLIFIRMYYEEIELFKKFKKPYAEYRKEKWSILPIGKGRLIVGMAHKIKGLRKILLRW